MTNSAGVVTQSGDSGHVFPTVTATYKRWLPRLYFNGRDIFVKE